MGLKNSKHESIMTQENDNGNSNNNNQQSRKPATSQKPKTPVYTPHPLRMTIIENGLSTDNIETKAKKVTK